MKFEAKFVGEIGSNHMRKFQIGKKLIDACKENGCSLIKMQLWKADDLYKGSPIYEQTKKLELNFDLAERFFKYAKDQGIDLFFSVFYPEAVDFCEEIGVKYYKIAAGSLQDYRLLEYVGSTDKPMFISFSNEHKYDEKRLAKIFKGNQVIQLYTVSKYPAKPEDFDCSFLEEIIFRNGGYSNHYTDLHACQLAICLGAFWIELHVMLEKECKKSPDCICSLTIDQLKELIEWQNKIRLLTK